MAAKVYCIERGENERFSRSTIMNRRLGRPGTLISRFICFTGHFQGASISAWHQNDLTSSTGQLPITARMCFGTPSGCLGLLSAAARLVATSALRPGWAQGRVTYEPYVMRNIARLGKLLDSVDSRGLRCSSHWRFDEAIERSAFSIHYAYSSISR